MRAVAVAALAVTASAQNFAYLPASLSPNTNELPAYNVRPFMQANARVQMFFDATEAGSSSFIADHLSLRYDGPIPQVGAPGPFTIQRLQIRIGATAVALPGARFADNLSQPLTTVLDSAWSYLPDPGSAAPQPWGDPGNSLTFPFTAPATVNIPPNGWLVIELVMDNNGQTSFAHAILDGARSTGGPLNGSASNFGQGCSAGPGLPAATMSTTGVHACGAAHFLSGQNLGANAPVFAIVGLSDQSGQLGNLPFPLPGTACTFYTSFELHWLLSADASGSIAPGTQAAALAVPPNPAFAGVLLHEQLLSFLPAANAFGFVLTDGRHVTVGALNVPGIGTYTVSHGSDSGAMVADLVEPFGYAVRLQLR
ncbi:MAG TPA: hypothetical protein VK348_03670 [Planctomycetota bacterium]|nr:hypothetical protein [Planctomycetota bacterium]